MRRRLFLLAVLPAGACSTGPTAKDCEREREVVRRLIREGELAEALSRAEACLAVLRGEAEAAELRKFRILESEILILQGRAKDGLATLDLVEPASLDDADEVAYWMHRGYGAAVSRRFDEGRRLLEKADRLSRSRPERPLAADIALRAGTVAARLGDIEAAERKTRESLELARADGDRYVEAMALGSLGRIHLNRRRYDEALDWFSQSLKINRAIGSQNALAKDLGNIGLCYSRLGLYDLAADSYRQALEVHTSVDNPIDRQTWLGDIGNLHFWAGDYAEARTHYLQALETARAIDAEQFELSWLTNLSATALESGDTAEASRYSSEAMRAARRMPDSSQALAARIAAARVAAAERRFEQAEALYSECVRESAEYPDKQVEAASRLGAFYAARGRVEEAEARLREAIEIVRLSRSDLRRAQSKAGYLAGVMHPYRAYVDLLMVEGRESEAFAAADSSRALALSESLEGRTPFGTDETATANLRRFRGETTLLYYWLAPERSYLWVVRDGELHSFSLPPEAEIEGLVETYQDHLTRRLRDPLETGDAAGRKLYEALVGPAAELISPGTHAVIAPDGALHRLSFESLVVPGRPGRYWVEDVELSITPTPRLAQTGQSAADRSLLLIGDAEPATEYPHLPAAAVELAELERVWPSPVSKVRGASATPEAFFKAGPERFGYIHFAAHAESNSESPLDSAVILSPRDGRRKLYARDVLQRRLDARLVTLSACRSAGSMHFAGEGLMGIAWAFLGAGAGSVIAGLWNVGDESTAQLMRTLYTGLAAGEKPSTALRNAKLSLIKSDGPLRKPFYWAPFQLYSIA